MLQIMMFVVFAALSYSLRLKGREGKGRGGKGREGRDGGKDKGRGVRRRTEKDRE